MVRIDDSYMVHLSSNLLLKFCGSLLKVYNLTLNESRTGKKYSKWCINCVTSVLSTTAVTNLRKLTHLNDFNFIVNKLHQF